MHTAVQMSSLQSHMYIDSMISFFWEKCSFFSCDLCMRSTWLNKQKLINKITFSISSSIVVVRPTPSLLKQNNYDLTTHVATLQTANIINSIPCLIEPVSWNLYLYLYNCTKAATHGSTLYIDLYSPKSNILHILYITVKSPLF